MARDLRVDISIMFLQLVLSLTIMAVFFMWYRRETVTNVRLNFAEHDRLENLRLYGKFDPPNGD
jgi:hypothetical protein